MGKLRKTSAGYTPLTASGFPTTYREEGLVGKLSSTSPPPIQKRGSWGSCAKMYADYLPCATALRWHAAAAAFVAAGACARGARRRPDRPLRARARGWRSARVRGGWTGFRAINIKPPSC